MLEFNDMSSPMRTTEVGQGHTVNVRVLPTAYSVDSRTISFAGTAPGVGPGGLHAFLDAAVLRRAIGGDVIQTPVAHGTLLIGERRFENVAFTYFAGD